MTTPRGGARRWPLVVVALVGLGLALAPAAFQMFTRAPAGGEMIADFEPYMTSQKLADFGDELALIDAARNEAASALGGPDGVDDSARSQYPSAVAFVEDWPQIQRDMGSMLATMDDNTGHYRGVAALPPFALFPWFFVVPGVLVAAVAGWTLLADRGRPPARGRRIALTVLGLGLVAAPAVFGMFTRAPGGAAMIEDFRPFMTEAKVARVQGYFLTIGAGEGQLRLAVAPDLAAATGRPVEEVLPAVHRLNEAWPEISGDLAPMVGTMADNVERFAGIAALPPFGLFPWFFVVPGVLVATLAWRSRHTLVAPIPIAPVAASPRRRPSRAVGPTTASPVGSTRVIVASGAVGPTTASPVGPAAALPTRRFDRRRLARIVATTAVVGELVSLGALNLLTDPAVATATTTRRPVAAAEAAASPTTTVVPARPSLRQEPLATPAASPAPVGPVTASPPVLLPPTPAPAVGAAASPTPLPCPLPVEPAPPGGGVASLTPLVPFFGPFSAEAFAMLPAFEPFFPLVGPLMVSGGDQLAQADPALQGLLGVAAPLESAGFSAVAPLYADHRQDVLDGEAALAGTIAPMARTLAAAPGAGCLPAAQAALLANPAPG